MSRIKLKLSSVLAGEMESYFYACEQSGRRVDKLAYTLKEFDELASRQGLSTPVITREFYDSWLAEHESEKGKTLEKKTCILRGLATHIKENGGESYVPPLRKWTNSQFTPYVFPVESLEALLVAVSKEELYDGHMNTVLFCAPVLLRTLAGAGPRIEETLSVKNSDVHIEERYILLRETKNRKERLLPLSESLAGCLAQYVRFRDKLPLKGVADPEAPFFVKANGERPSRNGAYGFFRTMLRKCGIPFVGNHNGPRLHDLRHTFAVLSMRQMTLAGMDVYASLPILSTCLGHYSPTSTETYVRLTMDAVTELEEQLSEINDYIYPKFEEGPEDGEAD